MPLGDLTAYRINPPGSTVASGTPSTWNPRTPKLTSSHGWRYATYGEQRDGSANDYANRAATVYRRRIGEEGWVSTGRVIREFANTPSIVADLAGRLYLTFHCVGECTSGGVWDQGISLRFYALIWDNDFDARGAYRLSEDRYQNWNETVSDTLGYGGLATDPSSARGDTYAAIRFPDAPDLLNSTQWVLDLYTPNANFVPVPRHFSGNHSLYPQMPMSEHGNRFISCGTFINGGSSSLYYGGFDLCYLSNQVASPVHSVNVSSPTDGSSARFAFPGDAAFDPDGRLYFIYARNEDSCTYFLIREEERGTGIFGSPISLGCRSTYLQIQIGSNGNVYLLQAADDALLEYPSDAERSMAITVEESIDDGQSFGTPVEFEVPRDDSIHGFPANTVGCANPTLTKPWTDPQGYDPDVLRGLVSNQLSSSTGWASNALVEFEIPIV
jgi:hypothetical protein